MEVARIEATSLQNVAVLRAQVDRYILIGSEAMRRGEWGSAQSQLVTALALIRSDAHLDGMRKKVESLLEQCVQKIAEQRTRESIRERLVDFQKHYDEAVFYQSDYTGLDPEANVRASRSSAGKALATFGRGPGHRDSEGLTPDSRYFDARELEKINVSCYELTLLLAESVSHPLPGENPAEQNRQALEILESARRLGGITPAFHLRRATALERSGDGPGAVAERKLGRGGSGGGLVGR